MMRTPGRLLTVAMLLVGAACSAATSGGSASGAAARTRQDRITFDEIRQRGQYSNLYDLIQDLRPRWLRSQGPDTLLGSQGEVQVHIDGNRMGGVSALRNMSPSGVRLLQWVGPIDAAARYGLDHGHGAIIISTGTAP